MSHHPHKFHILINKQKYELDEAIQTGATLKHIAGIPLGDVLFLQRPGEDEVIAHDAKITLKNGDHFHSQPPADYGLEVVGLTSAIGLHTDRVSLHSEPTGWSMLVIADYSLPSGFEPNQVELLIKLPPGFPDAAPDMFWIHPAVKTPSGSLPRSTCNERLLGKDWQRFSWHMAPGTWQPGVSDIRDFMRCIAARFLRLD